MNVRRYSFPSCLTTRYLFTIEFEDGTRRELYHSFLIDGEEELADLDFLLRNSFGGDGSPAALSFIEEKLKMFTRNLEAKIRSDYDGVINVRYKCVGIQAIN